MSTNVSKGVDFNKTSSFRFSTAKEILDLMEAPKPKITIMHAELYSDNIRVSYFLDQQQKHAKIMLVKIERFILDGYSYSEISDINVYYFLEENLYSVCQAYIAAGKEIIEL